MKTENFEKVKRENKRFEKIVENSKGNKLELFDFENFKITVKKLLIKLLWGSMVLVIIFGIFKIVKWGKVFNQSYIEYSNKKESMNLPILIGEKKLTEEQTLELKDFENRLNKIKIKVVSVETSTSTDTFIYNVLDVNNSNFAIKMNFDRNIEDTWNSFVSVYFSDDIKKLAKNKLEYIDVRYTSKVFYKLKSDKKLDISIPNTTINNNI